MRINEEFSFRNKYQPFFVFEGGGAWHIQELDDSRLNILVDALACNGTSRPLIKI